MQIVSKKGVRIYRDFYIDMKVNSNLTPNVLKIPISETAQSIQWLKTIGDSIEKYEIIAKIKSDIPIYSPVCGILTDIVTGPKLNNISGMQYAIIEVKSSNIPSYPLWKTEGEYSKSEILDIIKKSGIINEVSSDYLINTINTYTDYKKILIDCVDEQPYDLSKTAVVLNYQNEVLAGAKIIAKAFGIDKIELLIMKNFRTGEIFRKPIEDINVVKVKGKYPLYPEIIQYTHKNTGLRLGAQCCRAVYRATFFGEPQISNVITVWGDGVKYPQNLEVLFGTPVKDILDHCGANGIIERIVGGGVISGYIASPTWPVFNWNGAITVMSFKKHHKTIECINCGYCAKVCPMKLAPHYMMRPSQKFGEKIAKQLCAGMCVYCGSCSYICPSRLPITEKIREYNEMLAEGKII